MSGKLKGDLIAYWGKGQKDVMFSSTDGKNATNARRLLYHAFACVKMTKEEDSKSFLDELEARGFDLTTIRFSINRKAEHVEGAEGNNNDKKE